MRGLLTALVFALLVGGAAWALGRPVESEPQELSFDPGSYIPAPPEDVRAQRSQNGVQLQWQISDPWPRLERAAVRDFTVLRRDAPDGEWHLIEIIPVSETRPAWAPEVYGYLDITAATGTRYWYGLRSRNFYNESLIVWSNLIDRR
jgi:hypothetical protein